MTPKSDSKKKAKRRQKGDSGDDKEDEEERTARLLNEDPMDWMLKNEKVSSMLSVSGAFQNCSNV